MARSLVALGSNQGDRRLQVEAALAALGRLDGVRLVARSRCHETEAERAGDGGAFVNAAALLETRHDPRALLGRLIALEARLGRVRTGRRGPRTIDLDLILHDGRVASGLERLELPHPRFRERRFVLGPAAEVAPDLRDPVTGSTVRELLRKLGPAPARV